MLLIEPVWNRNANSNEGVYAVGDLLIEPVWNRNAQSVDRECCIQDPFNRTSMESKLRLGA